MQLGKYIGGGCSRNTYEHPTDKTKVIKREVGCYNNQREFDTWNKASRSFRRWLAPCYALVREGEHSYLIQARTSRLLIRSLREQLRTVPAFFDDIHSGNFGLYKNRVVCHDYALQNDEKSLRRKQEVCRW